MFGLLLGEVLEVFARPADEVLDAIHLWGALFFLVGIVSGVGVFLKVREEWGNCWAIQRFAKKKSLQQSRKP